MKLISSIVLICIGGFSIAQVNPEMYQGMSWRNVGPARGGRSIAVAGSAQRPNEFYFGATGGGVWKTTDAGKNWTQVSDRTFGTASVGALAVAPSDPNIVVAGTGERDIRGDISHGDGLYRSKDAGRTWAHIGLKDCQTISRVVIDPKDSETMLVAAFGHVYGPNRERGIYKTTDGGASWRKVLFESERAGAFDIILDPTNSKVVLASTWEAWRTPFSMNSGGPGSKLWKSIDGGETWEDISRAEGLPKGVLGKIGVAISPVDPNRYYALVESLEGGLFRSEDAGKTWSLINSDRNWRQRAWYYTHVYADPKNKDGVYVLNVGFGKSTDGGKTFQGLNPPHGDNHDLWINPDDPKRFIESNDGGANVTTDGGVTWTESTYSTGQFYHVTTDNAFPYRILGAQQDNSTVRIVSRKSGGNIGPEDWTGTAGGESGYIAVKPNDPDIVFGGSYGGDLSWINHRTNQSRAVDPWPNNPMGHGAEDAEYRFQWTYPIIFSQHNHDVLYTCSQYVLKSTDMGQSWQKISPDLTRNDKSTLGPSGGPITKDNTSVEYYGTVFTLAESPKDKNVLWAGSDDGRIHVTQNGGKSWMEITPPQMPKAGLVSMIEASPFKAGTAYVAVDNHENDDYAPYAYKTTDFGKTWTVITRGVGKDEFFRVIREDRRRPGLLYGGTERGVLISFDDGGNWQPLSLNLPITPVHDLAWKDDDLIAATHGRGFWVLDDLSPLQQMGGGTTTTVFAPKDPIAARWGGGGFGRRRRGQAASSEGESGANPMSGLVLSYYLSQPAKTVEIVMKDQKGTVVAKANGPTEKGFQRTSLWPQYSSWEMLPGMILWSGFPSPIAAPPGGYTVETTIDGTKTTHSFKWQRDPRSVGDDKALVEQFEFLQAVSKRLTEANQAVKKCRDLRAKFPNSPLVAELTGIEEAIYQTKNKSGQDPLNYPIRLNDKLAGVFSNASSSTTRPTHQAKEVFKKLSAELQVQLDRLAKAEASLGK